MKVTTLLVLTSVWLLRIKMADANYRRIIRGPPQPPRQPPYMKKWSHPPPPPRNQLRTRPLPPIKVPPPFNKPMGPPVLTTRHLIPARNVWKNPPSFKVSTEKPFLSSPTISMPEFDYHIQHNSIPTHTNTIKQVGEKGPIHTIPAPNLSPADKPSNIEQVKQIYQPQPQQQQVMYQQAVYQQKQPQPQRTIVEIQKSHQYQVTEDELAQHQVKLQPVFYDPKPTTVTAAEISSPEQLNNLAHAEFLVAPQPEQAQPLTPQELYKLLNLYPQQQQLLDSYALPVAQQPQLQQHLVRPQQPTYQAILAQFAQEDPAQRNHQVASRGKAETPADALAQAQYVQHYFDTTREENVVEPDAQATNGFDNEIPKDAFYSTLPSRQAAETLASLQEAGKVNNVQQGKKIEIKTPLTIYVPDNYESNEEVDPKDGASLEGGEYEDDLQVEANDNVAVQYQVESAYGNRVRPKTR